MEQFVLGSHVQLTNKANLNDIGIIRYIGQVEGKAGTWYGVELSEPKGKNDGSHDGKQYFKCKLNYGLLTTNKYIKPAPAQSSQGPTNRPSRPMNPTRPSATGQQSQSTTQLGKNTISSLQQKLQQKQQGSTSTSQATGPRPSASSGSSQKIKDLEDKLLNQETELKQSQENVLKKQEQISEMATKLEEVTNMYDQISEQQQQSQQNEQKLQLDLKQKLEEIELLKKQNSLMVDPNDGDVEKLQKYITLQKEVVEKDQEIMNLNEKINDSKKEFQQSQKKDFDTIESLKQIVIQKNNDIESLQKNLQSQIKLQSEQSQLSADQQESQFLEIVQEKTKLIQELEKQVQQLTEQQESDTERIEMLTIELEDVNLTKEELEIQAQEAKKAEEQAQELAEKYKQDMDDQQKSLEEAFKGNNEDEDSSNQTPEELKQSNIKLQHAVHMLNTKLEEEQISSLEKQIELEEQIEDLKFKSQQANQSKKEVLELQEKIEQQKEEIEELQGQLDDAQEAVDMVEIITEEKLKLEEQISEQGRALKDFREQTRIDQEMIDTLDESEKELQNILMSKEYEIYEHTQQIQTLQEQISEGEQQILKYKEKSIITKKQYELVQEELDSTLQGNNVNENLKKQQQLIQDYQDLLQEKREVYKEYLISKIASIQLQVEDSTKTQLYIDAIPQNIIKSLQPDALKIFVQLKKSKNSSILSLRELQKFLSQDKLVKQENVPLSQWVLDLLNLNTEFVSLIFIYEQQFFDLKEESEIKQLVENPINTQIIQGQYFIDQILRFLMDDTITANISLDPLSQQVQKIKDELQTILESIQESSEKYWISQILKSSFTVINNVTKKFFDLKYLKEENNIDNLYNTLLKRVKEFTDHILNGAQPPKQKESIQKYLGQIELLLTQKIQESNIVEFFSDSQQGEVMQTEESDDDMGSEPVQVEKKPQLDGGTLQQIDDFRQQTISLTNVLNQVNSELQQQLQYDTKEEKPKYWKQLAKKVCSEIEDVEKSINNEKKLEQDLQESQMKCKKQEKDLSNYKISNETLEKRVVKLELISDRVNVLESEVKSYKQREKHFKEAGETLKKELENQKRKNQDLEEETNSIREIMQQNNQSQIQGAPGQAPQKGRTQNSLLAKGLQNLLQSNKTPTSQFVSEESSTLVKYFRQENTKLRNKDLKERIQKLKSDCPMLELYKKTKKISPAPEDKNNALQDAIIRMNQVHNSVLDKYASVQVIDIKKLQEKSVKNETMQEFLVKQKTDNESYKLKAYEICNNLLSNISNKNDKTFKVRNQLYQQQEGKSQVQPNSQMVKLATLDLNLGNQQIQPQRLDIANQQEWQSIKALF